MDVRLFELINGLAGHYPWLDISLTAVAVYTPVLLAIILVVLWLTYRQRSQRAAFLAGVASLVALGIAQVIAWIVARPRPYAYAAHVLIARTTDTSFPSDHATLAFTIAAVMWHFHRRLSIALFGLAVLVSFARVYVGAHYPLDVTGGMILGTATGWAVGKLSSYNPLRTWIDALFSYLSRWRLATAKINSRD